MPDRDSQAYLHRHVEPALAAALDDTPVVCLLGPRQCGKSTLAVHHAPDRAYISLDDRNALELARNDPQGFIGELPERVTIDEVQRVPELTLAIKRSVDTKRRPGRFLLTGSANLLQLPRLSDSLAGRMEVIELQPFTEAEKEGTPGRFLEQWLGGSLDTRLSPTGALQPSTLPRRLIAGGYPESFRRTPARARQWLGQYIRSIIERDIHDVGQIKEGSDIARFIEYLSYRNTQLLNVTAIANALGHTRATTDKYLAILEKLYLARRLPAWHRNTAKRLVKTPKIHIRDSGLAAMLSDTTETLWTQDRSRFGPLLESFVVQQLSTQASWLDPAIRLWHYRDKDQVEVDCVLTRGRNVWGVEVKAANTVGSSDGKGLKRLAAQAGRDFQGGVLFYDGSGVLPLDRKAHLYAIPVSRLWEL